MGGAGRLPGDRIERFDRIYRGEERVWGVEPREIIAQAVEVLVPGSVLDLGSGDGRHALFLAEKGFHVTAVDIAPAAIARLEAYARQMGVAGRVKGVVADIEAYVPEGEFDNVISTFTLHFLARQTFPTVLERVFEATRRGGVNVIEDFTQNGPLYTPDNPGHWLERDELEQLYKNHGWHVLRYNVQTTETKAVDEQGNPYQQEAAAIIARKP